MRGKAGFLILFISGLIICICFSFWQKDNLKIIWDEYWSLNKSFHYIKEGLAPRTPAINEKIAKTDPEAAAVVNYRLLYRRDKQGIEILPQNILKFPDNQYFIYELCELLFYDSGNYFDPAILLKLSNRLIELDEKNAAYYYLKAYALFCDRKGNNFDEVTETVKQAAKCEYYKSPYSVYKDRAISIARKQGLHNHLIEELDFDSPHNPFIREIYETLIQYQNLLITERDFAKADEISDLLKSMLNNMCEPIVHCLPHSLYGLGSGFGRWNLPQEVELQRKNLTSQEADRKRLQMCAIVNPEKKAKLVNRYYEPSEKTQPYVIAVFPFIYLVRMTEVFTFLTAIFLIFLFFCKDNLNIKTSMPSLIRFLIYGFVYFFSSQFLVTKSFWEYQCCFSYTEVFLCRPLNFENIKDMFDAPLYFTLPFIIPLVVVLCMGIIRFFKPKFDNLISRFICGIMIAIPLGVITTILQGHTYLRYLPMVIFILFAFKYSFRDISLRNILKTFTATREDEAAALRTNLLKLSAIMVILCWLGFLLLVYPTKKSMEREEKEVKLYTYSFTEDYEKAYQDILKKIDDVNFLVETIPTYTSLVQSDDLPEVMEKLKKYKLSSYCAMRSLDFRPQASKDYNTITDRYISFMLRNAGRDQVPVIISYMDNPDNSWVLVFRARLDDKKVKGKLTNVLNEAIQEENDPVKAKERENGMEPRMFELVSALSALSEPDEAFALVKEYFDTHSIEQVDRYFNYRCFCVLPKGTVLKILNLYLDKAENEIRNSVSYRRYNSLYPLRDLEGLYWDSETAKKVLSLILQASDNEDKRLETFGVEYYLTSEASDLLTRGLQSDNENFRAWCIWQLRKINYKWSETELKKVAEDKSWKVRANLTLIDKSLIKENEPSDYVKLVKSM